MYVDYSGWSKEHGSFSCKIFIDEKKTDYEIEFGDGRIAKQLTPFEFITADWNNDGDVYTQFGASFESRHAGRDFWTVEELVWACADALDKETIRGSEVKSVKGITVPPRDKRPSLDETIRRNELRAANQEAEKNRKMDMLGIRRPGEPWAK